MKSARIYSAIAILSVVTITLSSCSAALYSSKTGVSDDLYATHDRRAIAEDVTRKAEIERAEAKAREAQLRAAIAQAQADAAQEELEQSGNPYQDILADDYETAYQRRLKGFNSPTYKMPSSYYNFRYGSDINYASAYDPSFYNVMVMGDQVWVEPKYVTSMFGNWGSSVNINLGFGGYWGDPYWNWGLNRPWYNGYYGWGNPYYGWGNPWWGGGYYPHHGYYPHWGHVKTNTSYRPNYGTYPGRGTSTTYRRPGSTTPSYNGGRGTSTTYRRGNSGTTNRGNSSTTYRRGNDETNTPTYERPSSTPSNSNSGGYSRGGGSNSGGGYSRGGGGNSGGGGGGSYNRR